MADGMHIHGDVEALVVDILKNQTPELEDANFTFSTDMKGYSQGVRWAWVSQEGSSKRLWNIINKPRIDVDVRAERRSVAKDAAEVMQSSIFRAVGTSGFGVTISRVVEETGLTRVPDKEEEHVSRWLFSVRLTCMQHPDSMPTPSF